MRNGDQRVVESETWVYSTAAEEHLVPSVDSRRYARAGRSQASVTCVQPRARHARAKHGFLQESAGQCGAGMTVRVGNWQSSAARCARSTCTCSIAPVEYRYVHVHVVKIASYYRGGVDVAVTALYCSVQSVDPLYSSLQSDSKVFADNSVATDQERIYLSELCSTCIAITALSRAKAGQWRCTAARETRGQNPCIP